MINENIIRPLEDWVKVRGHLDSSPVIYEWVGSVFGMTNEKPKLLFKIVGFNICKFLKEGNTWKFLSKEINIYLDPKTKQKINKWVNPYTNIEHHVCHIANESVCAQFEFDIPSIELGNYVIYSFNIHPRYENPLKDTEWDNIGDTYQSSELFKFQVLKEELNKDKVNSVYLSWTRISPWLPWMGDSQGYLLYTANGFKTDRVHSSILINELNRIPQYRYPPSSFAEDNTTSWSYFKDNIDYYNQELEFPLCI